MCTVIGGMSTQKQERMLNLGPQVVIATPGRLWKMIKEVNILIVSVLKRVINLGIFLV